MARKFRGTLVPKNCSGRLTASFRFTYLSTLFFTGMRPSEAAALRIRSVDLTTGTVQIERSRHLKFEAAPKTPAARRTVRLTPGNVDLLRQIVPLHTHPDAYLFTNVRGEPIDQGNFYHVFCDAQRALGIRLRDLYATKDTYVSLALTAGVSLTWLFEQTGVAESTLKKHYGRFVHSTAADTIELSKIQGAKVGVEQRPFAPRLPHSRRKRG
jgi:integrase